MHTAMRNLKLENFWYPQACGPHSSKVISSGPARPWRWLSIAANAVIEKSCGVDGGLERRCYVWSAKGARKEKCQVDLGPGATRDRCLGA